MRQRSDKVGRSSKFPWLEDHQTYRFLAGLWAGVIFCISSASRIPTVAVFPCQDKAVHVLVFGLLGFLIARSFSRDTRIHRWTRVALVALLVAFYGAFDEAHQLFVPGREGSLGDLGADITGGVISAVCFVRRGRVVPRGPSAEEDVESFRIPSPF